VSSVVINKAALPLASAPQWRETLYGNSIEAEGKLFEELARRMTSLQMHNAKRAELPSPDRTLHAKSVVGLTDATLSVYDGLPTSLRTGHFQPGRVYAATVRLSNANSFHRPDFQPDMRGAALRLMVSKTETHDLLMTSYPVSHARDAQQFVDFALIAAGAKALMIPRMLLTFGLAETRRIIGNLKQAIRTSESLAQEQYWSRGPILWGDAGPVQFRLTPLAPAAASTVIPRDSSDYLALELTERLEAAAVQFQLQVQMYRDEERTPIEDGSVRWKDEDSPPIPVALLTLNRQSLRTDEARNTRRQVDALSFNPWNAPPEFRPLGNLNRARRVVYAASAARWQAP
jgi:catalase